MTLTTQISSLLAKYAQHLLDENKMIQAIELYRKANYFLEAARLLADLAKEETEKRSSPLRIKKLYVLSALLVEEHLKNVKKNAKGAGVRSSALIGLVDGGGGGTGKKELHSLFSQRGRAGPSHFICLVAAHQVKPVSWTTPGAALRPTTF